jgi:hypothetical protein
LTTEHGLMSRNTDGDEPTEWRCECGRGDCTLFVSCRPSVRERVDAAFQQMWIVAPEHVDREDRVVERHPGFVVVTGTDDFSGHSMSYV